MRLSKSYLIAVALALGAAGWVLSGQLGDSKVTAESQKPPADLSAASAPQPVRVRPSSAVLYTTRLMLRGRTEAERLVEVRAETMGRVIELPVDRGDRVEAGQLIARLEDRGRSAALAEARALLAQRRIEHQAAASLSEKGFRAATQLAAAQAALEAAEAAVRRAEVEVEDTRITAPFDGVVDDRMIELGDYVDTGDAVMRIVDLDPIVVVAHVSERDVEQVRVGTVGHARLATGQEVEGEVAFVSSVADPATRTFRVELKAPNPGGALAGGVSAELSLPTGEAWAHKVSPALLTLSDEGTVGVKVVGEGNRARFIEVRILDYQADWVWLAGLPKELTLITVGQELAVDGEPVRPVEETAIERAQAGSGA